MKWYDIIFLVLIIPIGAYISRLSYMAKTNRMPDDTFLEKLYFKIQEWREKRRLKIIRKDKAKDYGC